MIYVVALDQDSAHRWIDKNLNGEKYKVVTSPWHLVGVQAEPEDVLYKVGLWGLMKNVIELNTRIILGKFETVIDATVEENRTCPKCQNWIRYSIPFRFKSAMKQLSIDRLNLNPFWLERGYGISNPSLICTCGNVWPKSWVSI